MALSASFASQASTSALDLAFSACSATQASCTWNGKTFVQTPSTRCLFCRRFASGRRVASGDLSRFLAAALLLAFTGVRLAPDILHLQPMFHFWNLPDFYS